MMFALICGLFGGVYITVSHYTVYAKKAAERELWVLLLSTLISVFSLYCAHYAAS